MNMVKIEAAKKERVEIIWLQLNNKRICLATLVRFLANKVCPIMAYTCPAPSPTSGGITKYCTVLPLYIKPFPMPLSNC